MRDITYCSSTDCPSRECKIRVLSQKFEPGEIFSMSDFSGTCRFYTGWIVAQAEEEENDG